MDSHADPEIQTLFLNNVCKAWNSQTQYMSASTNQYSYPFHSSITKKKESDGGVY